MDTQKLETYVDESLQKNFNMLLKIPIQSSKLMKSKLGAFHIKYNRQKIVRSEIVISYNFMIHNSKQTILDILYHECVHYALYTSGQPYKDSNYAFINTLKRLGVSRTWTYA